MLGVLPSWSSFQNKFVFEIRFARLFREVFTGPKNKDEYDDQGYQNKNYICNLE